MLCKYGTGVWLSISVLDYCTAETVPKIIGCMHEYSRTASLTHQLYRFTAQCVCQLSGTECERGGACNDSYMIQGYQKLQHV